MIKKIIFLIFTILIGICVNVILISKDAFNIIFFIVLLIPYIICTIGLFVPNVLFRITHWYSNSQLNDCNEIYIFIFKLSIKIIMMLSVIIPLWQLAPFEL